MAIGRLRYIPCFSQFRIHCALLGLLHGDLEPLGFAGTFWIGGPIADGAVRMDFHDAMSRAGTSALSRAEETRSCGGRVCEALVGLDRKVGGKKE